MCIAAPAQIVQIDREANVLYADFGGARQAAKMDLLPDVEVGEYVLIHAGYAIEKLSEEAAKESLEAWEELLDILEEEGWMIREMTRDLHAAGPVDVMTDYEARFYAEGVTIKRLAARKTEHTRTTSDGKPPRLRNAALSDARNC